ncbi:spore peptidoglycan hydrolase [Bacillus subtilis]|nr:spore peptidoglycan hydrolase [Bacillus subtilis]
MVKQGDTLSAIASQYRTTTNDITETNEIPNPDSLVVGQTIVIPIAGQFYDVKRGDTLTSIARQFNTTAAELARVNRIQLIPCFRLVSVYTSLQLLNETSNQMLIWSPEEIKSAKNLQQAAREASPYLTYLGAFSFQAQRNGTLVAPPLTNLRSITESQNTTLMMIITNLENQAFSDELGRILLNDETVKRRLLNEIVENARRYGFRDIHFDFEYLRPQDREAYNQFLREARDLFHREGLEISTALAPKTSATQQGRWYEAHDYRAHGEIVDFVVLMTYEWGYSGGPPQAVSPIGPVRDVIEYALTEMPANKIVMGQNLYGYDWTLPYTAGELQQEQ